MRNGYRMLVLAGLVCCLGTVARAESNNDAKWWYYDLTSPRAVFPEVEPNNSCPGQAIACGDVVNPAAINPANDVDYYEFSATAGTLVTIGTDAVNSGDNTDTYVELYPASCTAARLTYSDDDGPGAYSLITNFPLPSTGLYHIKVRGYSTTTVGPYKLFLTCSVPTPPPANDKCDGAIALQPCSSGHLTGDNTSAINDYGNTSLPCTGYAAAGRDVVYSVTLAAGNTLNVSYTAVADGSVYLITNCADPSGSCVAGADATLSGQTETFSYVAAAGGTFYLILDSYGTNTGTTWVLDYSITCPPRTGACCTPDGQCHITTLQDCGALGGSYLGDGTTCDPNPCPQPPSGACCINFVCTVTTQANCDGQWYGPGTTCDPSPCPPPARGACCFADGSCQVLLSSDCEANGGAYYGDGTSCNPNPCPQPPPTGACCYDDGSCIVYTAAECETFGGSYYGDGTVCDPNPCPQPPPQGACCLADGSCVVTTAADCEGQQGTYQGDNFPCDPNPCPVIPTRSTTWGQIKKVHR